ncbi:uncharacterized protein C8Q71DRAFT_897459 [Rhodofomes roseus]|uniref:Uncharacterized protein n=1 Tax=Rhodofomes roseus TaxID=34475 RepID=A0ABQ8KKT8_9APHY|nr:uncharacterized protein C8Q71DRAFT_897459 [Rhodofomes roseus]KAH9838764.1 hypothetical protein C8Q71DRAFT_897459 [Rhodofomes roseus]
MPAMDVCDTLNEHVQACEGEGRIYGVTLHMGALTSSAKRILESGYVVSISMLLTRLNWQKMSDVGIRLTGDGLTGELVGRQPRVCDAVTYVSMSRGRHVQSILMWCVPCPPHLLRHLPDVSNVPAVRPPVRVLGCSPPAWPPTPAPVPMFRPSAAFARGALALRAHGWHCARGQLACSHSTALTCTAGPRDPLVEYVCVLVGTPPCRASWPSLIAHAPAVCSAGDRAFARRVSPGAFARWGSSGAFARWAVRHHVGIEHARKLAYSTGGLRGFEVVLKSLPLHVASRALRTARKSLAPVQCSARVLSATCPPLRVFTDHYSPSCPVTRTCPVAYHASPWRKQEDRSPSIEKECGRREAKSSEREGSRVQITHIRRAVCQCWTGRQPLSAADQTARNVHGCSRITASGCPGYTGNLDSPTSATSPPQAPIALGNLSKSTCVRHRWHMPLQPKLNPVEPLVYAIIAAAIVLSTCTSRANGHAHADRMGRNIPILSPRCRTRALQTANTSARRCAARSLQQVAPPHSRAFWFDSEC